MSILEKYPLKIGDLIAKIPIIQGGMGVGISLSGLSSAVANEGGIGVIAAADVGMNESDFFEQPTKANVRALRKEIRKARELTDGIVGVNIMYALTDYADFVRASIEEGIDIIFSGAGLSLGLPKFLSQGAKTKLVPIISSAKAASVITRRWLKSHGHFPDAFVVEGPRAGGHLGFKIDQIDNPDFTLEKIVCEVVNVLKPFEEKHGRSIPVIAAGGIFTGQDILKFLQLGAAGVQMATRFVATDECDANIGFKQAYIDAEKTDVVLIQSPVGMIGRAIGDDFLELAMQGKKIPKTCPYQCLKTCRLEDKPIFCISFALMNAKKGNLGKKGFAFCGDNVHRVKKIISVAELFASIKKEFDNACD